MDKALEMALKGRVLEDRKTKECIHVIGKSRVGGNKWVCEWTDGKGSVIWGALSEYMITEKNFLVVETTEDILSRVCPEKEGPAYR